MAIIDMMAAEVHTISKISVTSPFPDYAVPRIWSWMEEFRWRVADDFAVKTQSDFVDEWDRLARVRRSWGVYRNGELGGLVTVRIDNPHVASTHCLFAKRFWSQETTLPALRQVYRTVFEEMGYGKLAFLAFAENHQLLAMVKQLGAKREGVLREHTVRSGKFVDMMAIGLTKGDFYADRRTSGDNGGYCSIGRGAGEHAGSADAEYHAAKFNKRGDEQQPEITA